MGKFDTPLTHSALRTDVVPLTERNLQHLSISQPIVIIACPQQALSNHMELQNTYCNFSSKK